VLLLAGFNCVPLTWFAVADGLVKVADCCPRGASPSLPIKPLLAFSRRYRKFSKNHILSTPQSVLNQLPNFFGHTVLSFDF